MKSACMSMVRNWTLLPKTIPIDSNDYTNQTVSHGRRRKLGQEIVYSMLLVTRFVSINLPLTLLGLFMFRVYRCIH
jgi:hypothetical protein